MTDLGISVLYLVNLAFAIWAMWPNKELNDVDDDDDADSLNETSKPVEMQNIKTPNVQATPFTPRTTAFHTLDRQLPLRSNKYG